MGSGIWQTKPPEPGEGGAFELVKTVRENVKKIRGLHKAVALLALFQVLQLAYLLWIIHDK